MRCFSEIPTIVLGKLKICNYPTNSIMKRQITKFKIVQIVEIVIPPKKIIQIANKHMKWCLTALAIKEMQIITTVECHFTPTSVLIIIKIKPDKSKCWQACGEIRTSYISDKSVKYFSFGRVQ